MADKVLALTRVLSNVVNVVSGLSEVCAMANSASLTPSLCCEALKSIYLHLPFLVFPLTDRVFGRIFIGPALNTVSYMNTLIVWVLLANSSTRAS
jgi:hypothetical protein